MTFLDFLMNHRTKILGTVTTIVATLLGMIALGMFAADATSPALLEPVTVRWMTIVLSLLNVALGGGTVAVGLANTTRERVATAEAAIEVAKADQARSMETSINTAHPAGRSRRTSGQ